MSYYLYLVSTQTNETKIGISNDPERRFKAIQAHNPQQLILCATIEYPDESTARQVEQSLHRYFRKRHIHYEWFKISAKQVLNLINLVTAISPSVIKIDIQKYVPIVLPRTHLPRTAAAIDSVVNHLKANPDNVRLTVRELGELIGVGKDTAAKGRALYLAELDGRNNL